MRRDKYGGSALTSASPNGPIASDNKRGYEIMEPSIKEQARQVAYEWCMTGGNRDALTVADVRDLAEIIAGQMRQAKREGKDEQLAEQHRHRESGLVGHTA